MKSIIALLVTMFAVGSILVLAADPPGKPVIIKGSTDTEETTTTKGNTDLVGVDLNAAMLAKREAAMDEMEAKLDAEFSRMVTEHKRRVKEQMDWRTKERGKLGK